MKLKLQDTGHSYYCGCTVGGGSEYYETYDSWSEFMYEFAEADDDLNCLFRFDIIKDDESQEYNLHLFFVLQRKGSILEAVVNIEESDLPEIQEYLKQKKEYLDKLWAY